MIVYADLLCEALYKTHSVYFGTLSDFLILSFVLCNCCICYPLLELGTFTVVMTANMWLWQRDFLAFAKNWISKGNHDKHQQSWIT